MPRGKPTEDSEFAKQINNAVARDPDIGGVYRRADRGIHIRHDDPEFRASIPSRLKGKPMSISEIIGALTEATVKAGEALSVSGASYDQLVTAVSSTQEAINLTHAALGDAQAQPVMDGANCFADAEQKFRDCMATLERLQGDLRAGVEHLVDYTGRLS